MMKVNGTTGNCFMCWWRKRLTPLFSNIITHHLTSNYEKIFNSIYSLILVSCETNTVEVSKLQGSGLCLV